MSFADEFAAGIFPFPDTVAGVDCYKGDSLGPRLPYLHPDLPTISSTIRNAQTEAIDERRDSSMRSSRTRHNSSCRMFAAIVGLLSVGPICHPSVNEEVLQAYPF